MAYLLPDMPADERALVATIQVDPDDDAPRLVYADWLDEHGDPDRAELLRVRVAQAALTSTDDAWWDLSRRGDELEAAARAAVRPAADPVRALVWFDRGMPERLVVTNRTALGPALGRLARDLPLRSLDIQYVDDLPAVAAALGRAARARVQALTWDGGSAGERAYQRMPLAPEGVAQAVAALAAGRQFPNLEWLEVRHYPLDADAAAAIAAAPFAGRLVGLTLRHAGLTAAAIEALFGPASLSRVYALDMSDNPLGDAGAQALADYADYLDLRFLDLSRDRLGPDGAAAVAGMEALLFAEDLVLGDNAIGEAGGRALTYSTHLHTELRLYLYGNRAGAAGRTLRRRFANVYLK